MKKVEKFWRLKAQIGKSSTHSLIFKTEPTEEDVQKFSDSLDKYFGEITVEIFWRYFNCA